MKYDQDPQGGILQQVVLGDGNQEGASEQHTASSKGSQRTKDKEQRHRLGKIHSSGNNADFLRRNLTMLKISSYVVFGTVYHSFAVFLTISAFSNPVYTRLTVSLSLFCSVSLLCRHLLGILWRSRGVIALQAVSSQLVIASHPVDASDFIPLGRVPHAKLHGDMVRPHWLSLGTIVFQHFGLQTFFRWSGFSGLRAIFIDTSHQSWP
jgi:hypothetical protein